VGAALIAALTVKRMKEGQLAGIRDYESLMKMVGKDK
jgi:hexokinase